MSIASKKKPHPRPVSKGDGRSSATSRIDVKSEFLNEAAERYAYWRGKANTIKDKAESEQAMKVAEAYERVMCMFTMPADVKKNE